MTIKLIVGLANPGAEYAATRHNAGAWFVDLLAERLRAPLREEAKFFGYTSRVTLGGEDVRLLVPTTFMNLSGKAVAAYSAPGFARPTINLIVTFFCPECVHNWRVVYWLRPRLTKNCVSNADNVIIA